MQHTMISKLATPIVIAMLMVSFFIGGNVALGQTTWKVPGDGSNTCTTANPSCNTIQGAVNAASSGDTINVAAGTYNENVTINKSVTVTGTTGPGITIVDGFQNGSVFAIANTVNVPDLAVSLMHLTITNGNTGTGDGGGGIVIESGIISVSNCTITSNTAGGCGGAVRNLNGTVNFANSNISGNVAFTAGGICNDSTMTITNSTISGNFAQFEGGISNNSTMTITNSTIAGNRASMGSGYGIVNARTMTITNCTINGNDTGNGEGGGILNGGDLRITFSTISGNNGNNAQFASGIQNTGSSPVILDSSILANNPFQFSEGEDCSGSVLSLGYNMSTDNSCNLTATGDLPGTFPLLGRLQNNGGATDTQALESGSPGIGAGNPNCPPPATDQRGVARPQGKCDIGAFQTAGDDVDKDGIPNSSEGNPTSGSTAEKNNSEEESDNIQAQTIGTDGDEIPNFLDLDSDGDCIPDHFEAGGANDGDSDGIVDNFIDLDGDGLHDLLDPSQGGTPLPLLDTDGDGLRDFIDQDSDDDGETDNREAGGTDEDGDGINDNSSDENGDGLADVCHPDTGESLLPLRDSDRDGIPNHLDAIDNSGDGCSLASVGTKSSIPLYLLVPVFIVIRIVWRRYVMR